MSEVIHKIRNIPVSRTVESSFVYATSELGELADEVLSGLNMSIKPNSEDGILGECVDVMVCMLDIIQLSYPQFSSTELSMLIDRKLLEKVNKWSNKDYSKKQV